MRLSDGIEGIFVSMRGICCSTDRSNFPWQEDSYYKRCDCLLSLVIYKALIRLIKFPQEKKEAIVNQFLI